MDRDAWHPWMVPIAFVLPIFTRWMFKIWWFDAPDHPLPDRVGRTVFALGICLMGYLALVAAIDDLPLHDWETGRRRQRWLVLLAILALSGPLYAYMHSRRVGTVHNNNRSDETGP